jgi:adenine-specific DNA methylase
LSPETKAQRKLEKEAANAERKRIAKAAEARLIEDRKAYSSKIWRLALCYATPPELPQRTDNNHHWKTYLCLGKSGDFENVGQWFRKVKLQFFLHVLRLHLLYSSVPVMRARHAQALSG